MARKKSSVDVNLLADGEESSMDEVDEDHGDGRPQISSGDDCKQDIVGGGPTITSVQPLGQDPNESSDDSTLEFPRASEDEIYDLDECTLMHDAGGNSNRRQTAVSAQGYKAVIPLLGKPKVRCYDIVPCNGWLQPVD